MSKIVTALMFGCAVLLASDASFARARGRASTPPSKPAAAQPAKPAHVQASKPGTQKQGTVEPQKPFAAAPRPGSTFVNINTRPLAAAAPAAAPAQHAMHDSAEQVGPLRYDPILGLVPANGSLSAKEPAAQPPKETVAETSTPEPSKTPEPSNLQPTPANVRMASPSMPAPGKRAAPVTIVCYVQLSGACVPF